MITKAKEYILNNWGENWTRVQWNSDDVIDALAEFAEQQLKILNMPVNTNYMKRNKIIKHYKSFFGLEDVGLAENDQLMIDWAESLVKDYNLHVVNNSAFNKMMQNGIEDEFNDLISNSD